MSSSFNVKDFVHLLAELVALEIKITKTRTRSYPAQHKICGVGLGSPVKTDQDLTARNPAAIAHSYVIASLEPVLAGQSQFQTRKVRRRDRGPCLALALTVGRASYSAA